MFLNFNGEVREEKETLLRADNRGFRYGDGLFETMLVRSGKVRLGRFHVERLVAGMRLLRLDFPQLALPRPFGLDSLEEQIGELCLRNGHEGLVRARLTVFRAGGGGYNGPERQAGYILQTGDMGNMGSDEGLVLGVFPDGRRTCDAFSAIKSNNYQLSTQAGMFAVEAGWDDCVLLNSWGRVAETAIANVWWVGDGRVHTPPLSEGCVAGVMRRFLLEALPAAGYAVRQEPVSPQGLAAAEEVFVSNAIRGIRWVRRFGGIDYAHRLVESIRELMPKI